MLYSAVYIGFDPRPFFSARPRRSDAVSVVSFFHCPTIPYASRFPVPFTVSPFFGSSFCTILGQCKPLSCSTYGSPSKCCKKKTCSTANSFRCNTYKKHRGGGGCISCFLKFFTRLLPQDSSSVLSYSCALYCAFLQPGKTQLLSSQATPHSLPKTTRGGVLSSTKTKQFRPPGSFSYNRPALCGTPQPTCPVGARTKDWFRGA